MEMPQIGSEWLFDGWEPVLLNNEHNRKLILLGFDYCLEKLNNAFKLIKQQPFY